MPTDINSHIAGLIAGFEDCFRCGWSHRLFSISATSSWILTLTPTEVVTPTMHHRVCMVPAGLGGDGGPTHEELEQTITFNACYCLITTGSVTVEPNRIVFTQQLEWDPNNVLCIRLKLQPDPVEPATVSVWDHLTEE